MNKQEFLDRIKSDNIPSDSQFAEIEYVYTWHPIISEVTGKDQIAKLWDIGGIRLIRDMKPTAEKAQVLEHEATIAENKARQIRRALLDLGMGGMGNIDE